MCNTRFNPSATGSLHIGHIYMALVNEHMAHDSGGKFHVRFCDEPNWETRRSPEDVTEVACQQLDELIWMGIRIDSVSFQSEQEKEVRLFLANSNLRMVIDNSRHAYYSKSVSTVHIHPEIPSMPFSMQHTAEKVVFDYWGDSDVLIRGFEWIQEHFLYMYFCAVFGFRYPKCYYISRLFTSDGDVSKTTGNWQVKDLYEAGVSPAQIRSELKASCLVDPAGPWDIDNIKYQPILVSRSVEDVLRQR